MPVFSSKPVALFNKSYVETFLQEQYHKSNVVLTMTIFDNPKFTKQFLPAVSSPSEAFLLGLDPLDWLSDLNPAMSLTVANGIDVWLSVSVLVSVISDTVTDEIDGRLFPVSAVSVTITERLIEALLASVDWALVDLLASNNWLFVDLLTSIV